LREVFVLNIIISFFFVIVFVVKICVKNVCGTRKISDYDEFCEKKGETFYFILDKDFLMIIFMIL
jgi:hypothetical protein